MLGLCNAYVMYNENNFPPDPPDSRPYISPPQI